LESSPRLGRGESPPRRIFQHIRIEVLRSQALLRQAIVDAVHHGGGAADKEMSLAQVVVAAVDGSAEFLMMPLPLAVSVIRSNGDEEQVFMLQLPLFR